MCNIAEFSFCSVPSLRVVYEPFTLYLIATSVTNACMWCPYGHIRRPVRLLSRLPGTIAPCVPAPPRMLPSVQAARLCSPLGETLHAHDGSAGPVQCIDWSAAAVERIGQLGRSALPPLADHFWA